MRSRNPAQAGRFTSRLHRAVDALTVRGDDRTTGEATHNKGEVVKKVLPFVVAALMIPSVALAKGPNPNAGTHTNHGKANVMYVLKGMIYAYAPYDASTNTPGSITIDVKSSNRHGKLLNGQTGIQITVGPNTKIELENGVTSIALTQPGDLGTVKVRAPRLAFKSATLSAVQTALQNHAAHMVTDWGPAS
jgi:hypothetical protein